MDLALNNLQRLICHKTKQTKPNQKRVIGRVGLNYQTFENTQKLCFMMDILFWKLFSSIWSLYDFNNKNIATETLKILKN